jgi:hypothetical protein
MNSKVLISEIATEAQPARLFASPPQQPLLTRLAVSWSRAIRWEFWPAWIFYMPVALYIVARSLRSAQFLSFTAANPGIDAGGFVGERKDQSLLALVEHAPDLTPEVSLIARSLPEPVRLALLQQSALRLGFPLVIKPNVGQRGRGVTVIHDLEQASAMIRMAPEDVLVQGYAAGEEFGVFAYRYPGQRAVTIYSITHKCFPIVTGDGVSTLAALIMADARARLISGLLWQRLGARLQDIPKLGEQVTLVEIGAHCRGSLFLDASEFASPELVAVITRLFDAVPGYCFGRIDLRCRSREALTRGEGIQTLELNGVTAEAAHIYHPGTPLLTGWRSMIRQWRIAFEIGEANLQQGTTPTSISDLRALIRQNDLSERAWTDFQEKFYQLSSTDLNG